MDDETREQATPPSTREPATPVAENSKRLGQRVCLHCGLFVSAGDMFCRGCGLALGAGAPPRPKPPRPRIVTTAIRLLYLWLGVDLLANMRLWLLMDTAWERFTNKSFLLTLLLIAIGVEIVGFWILIRLMARGKNWARITSLGLYCLYVTYPMLRQAPYFDTNPIINLVGLSQIVTGFIALVFLFQKPSSQWFETSTSPSGEGSVQG